MKRKKNKSLNKKKEKKKAPLWKNQLSAFTKSGLRLGKTKSHSGFSFAPFRCSRRCTEQIENQNGFLFPRAATHTK